MAFLLDPNARLDYAFDWTPWLEDGETIDEATVTPEDGVTIDGDPDITDGLVTVWLHEGQLGKAPLVTCHVVTSAGREDDRSLRVTVQQR